MRVIAVSFHRTSTGKEENFLEIHVDPFLHHIRYMMVFKENRDREEFVKLLART